MLLEVDMLECTQILLPRLLSAAKSYMITRCCMGRQSNDTPRYFIVDKIKNYCLRLSRVS